MGTRQHADNDTYPHQCDETCERLHKEVVELKMVFGNERCAWGANHWQGKTWKLTLGKTTLVACEAHLIEVRKFINRAVPPVVDSA